MRKTFAVVIVVDGWQADIEVTGTQRIGSTYVELPDLPGLQLIMDAEEPTKQLLKDALVHVIEHL